MVPSVPAKALSLVTVSVAFGLVGLFVYMSFFKMSRMKTLQDRGIGAHRRARRLPQKEAIRVRRPGRVSSQHGPSYGKRAVGKYARVSMCVFSNCPLSIARTVLGALL